jgi:hypothetical protein
MNPQAEHLVDDGAQPVPHGALADLCVRAERIRQAYEELRAARRKDDAQKLQP